MRIGELARDLRVSTDTIRFYERSGVLPRPARRSDNNYREYSAGDAEHLRLLVDLRRLGLPLDDAARVAGWCHVGHCDRTTSALPALLADRRAAIAARIEGLRVLDARLADLERHLARERHALVVVDPGRPCCDAASAITGAVEGGCACCAAPDPAMPTP